MRPPSCDNHLMCHPAAVLATRFLPLADCIRPAESGTAGKAPENVLAAESGTARRGELKKVQHMRRQVERPWPGHARGERRAAGHRADGSRQRGGRTPARLSERAETRRTPQDGAISRPKHWQAKAKRVKGQWKPMRQQDYLRHERQTRRGLRHYVKERVQVFRAHSKQK